MQFRPGGLLADVVENLAKQWRLSRNEAARRLVALAAHDLDERHHELVVEFADRMPGGGDFTDACSRLYVELQAINTGRCQGGRLPMSEDERHGEIERLAKTYVLLYRDPENPTEERLRVRISRND